MKAPVRHKKCVTVVEARRDNTLDTCHINNRQHRTNNLSGAGMVKQASTENDLATNRRLELNPSRCPEAFRLRSDTPPTAAGGEESVSEPDVPTRPSLPSTARSVLLLFVCEEFFSVPGLPNLKRVELSLCDILS